MLNIKNIFPLIFLLYVLHSCSIFTQTAPKEKINSKITGEEFVTKGIDFFEKNEDKKAIEAWKKALFYLPDDAEIYNFIGLSYHRTKNTLNAARAFKQASELDTLYFEALNNYGYMLFLQKKYYMAKNAFKRALQVNSNYKAAQENLNLVNSILENSLDINAFNLSEKAAEQKDILEQIKLYEKALKITPDYAKAHNNLGVAYYRDDNHDKATKHFVIAIKLNPSYPEALNNLGYIAMVSQRYEKAIPLFFKALNLKPKYISALTNLGEVYFKLNEIENAHRLFKTVLEFENENKIAQHFLERIRHAKGE